jgi:predicted nucleic acid-binding protein
VILVDTSVWIDHLRRGNAVLAAALERDDVLTHPFVIGEIACGSLKNRREVLDLLAALPSAVVASDQETYLFIERRRLMGKGIGYIDAHLLTSVTLTDQSRLWTLDKRLALFAGRIA